MSFVSSLLSLINSDKKLKMAARGVIILLVIIPAVLYTQKPKSDPLSESSKVLGSNTLSLDQVNEIVAKVAKIADIPPETPNVATVSDVAVLKGQLFFSKAENGDKVLIFQNAKRAILYRPSTNRIIEYSTIVVEQETPAPTQGVSEGQASPSATPAPKINFVPVTATPVPSETQPQAQ